MRERVRSGAFLLRVAPVSKSLVRGRGAVVLSGVVWLLAAFVGSEVQAKTPLDAPILLTQVPRQAKSGAKNWNSNAFTRADWFEGARIVAVSPEGKVQVLSQGAWTTPRQAVRTTPAAVANAARIAAGSPRVAGRVAYSIRTTLLPRC